ESNDVGVCRFRSKRVLDLQAQEIAAAADDDVRVEGQPAEKFSAEQRFRSGLAHDKRARRADVDHIEAAQRSCEQAWAKRPVPAHVDTPEKDNQSGAWTS